MAQSARSSRPTPSLGAAGHAPADVSDVELLSRFFTSQDSAAFELLLRRHGAMAMALLRRMGLQEADAEDAFQATFLTLVRKGHSIGNRTAAASWLYKVAFRIALEIRRRGGQRQQRQQPLTGNEPGPAMENENAELWVVLEAEVTRLPEKYRVPFILCHLQGLSLEQAAHQVGSPAATVGTWLARARQRLRSRLAARGLAVSAPALLGHLATSSSAQAAVPPAVLQATLQAAVLAQGGALAGAASAEVLALSSRAAASLTAGKAKVLAAALVLVLALAAVAGLVLPSLASRPAAEEPLAGVEEDWLRQWGQVIDPDGDSQFRATRTSLTVTVAGLPHVFAPSAGRANAPRVVRQVRGDFLVQVRVGFERFPVRTDGFEKGLFPTPMTHPLNSSAFCGAGFLLAQDAGVFLKSVQGWSLGIGGRSEGLVLHSRVEQDSEVRAEMGRPAVYLRIERLGPHLFAASSPDGERLSYRPALTGALPNVLQLGLVAENNAAEGCVVTFTDWRLSEFRRRDIDPKPRQPGPPQATGCIRCHPGGVPARKMTR